MAGAGDDSPNSVENGYGKSNPMEVEGRALTRRSKKALYVIFEFVNIMEIASLCLTNLLIFHLKKILIQKR